MLLNNRFAELQLQGLTTLMTACAHGQDEAVLLLLSQGANVNLATSASLVLHVVRHDVIVRVFRPGERHSCMPAIEATIQWWKFC